MNKHGYDQDRNADEGHSWTAKVESQPAISPKRCLFLTYSDRPATSARRRQRGALCSSSRSDAYKHNARVDDGESQVETCVHFVGVGSIPDGIHQALDGDANSNDR